MIIGNSGSGKSSLAARLATTTSQPVFDLDLIHWCESGLKRDEDIAKNLVTDIAGTPAWIIEGVYGWLAEVALDRATALIWLDLPWRSCRDGLLRRGLRRGMTPADQESLVSWGAAYRTRTSSSSFTGHKRTFDAFPKEKIRLATRADIDALLASVDAGSL